MEEPAELTGTRDYMVAEVKASQGSPNSKTHRLSINTTLKEPTEHIGTRDYMVPEVKASPGSLESKNQETQGYTNRADIMAVGLLAYKILTGVSPFKGCHQQKVTANIMRSCPAIPLGMSKEAVNFIELAMEKDPSQRPTARQLQLHLWIQDQQTIMAINARAARLRSLRKYPSTSSKPPMHQSSPAPVVRSTAACHD
eukprot:gene17700-24058_t